MIDREDGILVLIADDNEDTGLIMQSLLEQEGFVARLVKDGVEALATIEQSRPDLLITDINMPRKDGITLIKEIRREEALGISCPPLPIIVASNETEEMLSLACLAGAGFAFDKLKMMQTLTSLINKISEMVQESLATARLHPAT